MARQSLSAYRDSLNNSSKEAAGASNGGAKKVTIPSINQTKSTTLAPQTAGSSGSSGITFSSPGSSGGSTKTASTDGNSYSYRDLYRNAAVDQAAINKQTYTPDDIKTYANRETAYNFLDKNTGKINTVYSNLTNYKDAAREAGYDLDKEGKDWSMSSAATYGISGSSGRGTAYGASQGKYTYNEPASGGWYGEAGRAIRNANSNYGGLDNVIKDTEPTYRSYIGRNYIPVQGMTEDEINWDDVASGKAAENYYNAVGEYVPQTRQTYAEPVEEEVVSPTGNYWDSYINALTSGIANNTPNLAYTDPLAETSVSDAVNNAITSGANPIVYNPINAAQWNYDVPETVLLQNNYPATSTASESAYSGLLAGPSEQDLEMAAYWANIAATTTNPSDREYALRQAQNYRSRIAG